MPILSIVAFMNHSKEEIVQTHCDLIRHLQQIQENLNSLCNQYDNGSSAVASLMAGQLRILLHDAPVHDKRKNKSRSLLQQLGIKDTIKFFDTAHPYNENNLLTSSCLTLMNYSSDGHTCEAKIFPLLGANFKPCKIKGFPDWWGQIVLSDNKNKFSRKDVIMLVADKDGGAHIDEKLPKGYYDLTRNNSMKWVFSSNGVEEPLKDYWPASIRQITFEMLKTLDNLNIDLWRF